MGAELQEAHRGAAPQRVQQSGEDDHRPRLFRRRHPCLADARVCRRVLPVHYLQRDYHTSGRVHRLRRSELAALPSGVRALHPDPVVEPARLAEANPRLPEIEGKS